MGTPEQNRSSFTWGCLIFVAITSVLVVIAARTVVAGLIAAWAGLF